MVRVKVYPGNEKEAPQAQDEQASLNLGESSQASNVSQLEQKPQEQNDKQQSNEKNTNKEKPTMRSLAHKSILKTRQERQQQGLHRHPRLLLPGGNSSESCVIDLGGSVDGLVGIVSRVVNPVTGKSLLVGAELKNESAVLEPAAQAVPITELRVLKLDAEQDNEPPEELDTRLLWFARAADWQAVDELTSNKRQMALFYALGASRLQSCVTEGSLYTSLHFAARDNKTHIVERLIKLGLNVNARSCDNLTPLHLSYMFMPTRGQDCDATARALLLAGADPMARGGSRDQLPVHIVASKASFAPLSALDHLLDLCPPETRLETDAEGCVPLHIAVHAGNVGAVQDLLLVSAREQLHFKQLVSDEYAIHMATKQKDIEILKIIIDAGCNLDLQNGKGQTALHLAAANEMDEFVRILCQAGADPDVQDKEHQSPIHLATARGYQKIVDILSEKFKASIMYRTKDGSTLMHLASSAYNAQAALSFIRKGIPIHMPNREGAKCVHIAAIHGHVEVVKAIVAKGENVDSRTKDGFTPLHLAVKFGKHELVEALLGMGANLQLKAAKGGETALHLATLVAGGDECVDLLIRSGAHVDAVDARGETPMHFAARANNLRAVELLLEDGADIGVQNECGENVLHVCVKHAHLDLMRDTLIAHIVTKRQVQQAKRLINQQNKLGESAVHYAADSKTAGLAAYKSVVLSDNTDDKYNFKAVVCSGVDTKQPVVVDANIKGKKNNSTADNNKLNIGNENEAFEAERKSKLERDTQIMRALLVNGGDAFLKNLGDLETPLHYACRAGNTQVLHELLAHLDQQSARLACNKPARALWTPLFYACHEGHADVIRMLLNQTARIDVFDESGEAPLHVAVRRGHAQVLDILLEHSAFVNVRNKPGMTPLHIAAARGYNSMVKQLVSEHAAILDAMTLVKQTPLHLAAESGQLEVCKTLMALGADVHAVDNQSQTPLHLAARTNRADVLKLFLSSSPSLVGLTNKDGLTCAHIAAMNGSLEAIREVLKFSRDAAICARIKKTNSTALHLASENGNAEIVRLLLQSGASASDENGAGETALQLAARHGHVRVLHTIRNSDWKLASRRNGLTALHVASACGRTEFVAEMLRGRVPGGIRSTRSTLAAQADFGLTPLHLACGSGHENVVRMLLNSAGVQVDAASERLGTLPVHLAAQGGHLLVAGLLISRSTQGLTQADARGCTALHLAAAHGHRDMVGLLIGQGAPINAQDLCGLTPLHYSARNGFLNVVRLLVESGADASMTCANGKVPLCMAAASGHKHVLSYLLTKEHDPFELMHDKAFLIDLMSCGKQHANKPLQEFILVMQHQAGGACSQAPLEVAVKLAKCYETLVEKNKDRARDFYGARDFCDQVATDLLTIVASTNNSTLVLKSLDRQHVEFLDVLIELDRRDVVSQHSVQKYLSDVWIGELSWSALKMVMLFFAFLVAPPLWAAISCPAGHSLATVPVIKFMSYLASHVFFILLLILATLNPWLPIYRWESLATPPFHEWLLLLWFLGLLATTMSNPPERAGLGSIKLINLILGFLAVFVHAIGAVFANQEAIPYVIFARNQFLALVMLLSFFELLNFLTFHHLFGPWAVIIQDLVKDMLRFLVILGIFLLGFSLTVSAIYVPIFEPIQQQQQLNALSTTKNNQQLIPTSLAQTPSLGTEFHSPFATFEMLFYSLFGLVEPDLMPPMHSSPAISKHIMKLVFGVYMMITVIVLINLLIAMMSNTYQRIEARSDIEWKFGRAKLIRNMIRTSPTPSPLILLMGIWIDLYRELKRRQAMRVKVEKMAVAAFNRRASLSESTVRLAQFWASKSPSYSTRKALETKRKGGASKRSFNSSHTESLVGLGEDVTGAKAAAATANVTNRNASANLNSQDSNATTDRQITGVVNWQLIVRMYWEEKGVVCREDNEAGASNGDRAANESAITAPDSSTVTKL